MAYPVTELITDAYHLSGIVSEEFEEITGYQIDKGLKLLNGALAFKTVEDRTIPYFQQLNFTATIGQEQYFIQDLIEVETLTFTIDSVRYQMTKKTRYEYFGTPRANNINSLPYMYFIEKALGGANLYMYFFPQQAYTFQLHGKFRLNSNIALNQDMELIFDQYYIQYLKYLLAEYLCEDYQIQLPSEARRKLTSYEKSLFDVSEYDLSMRKTSILQSATSSPDIYAQANIGKGWTAPS